MFALFEVVGFCLAFVFAFVTWRPRPERLLRIVIWGGRIVLIWVFVEAAVGVPLFLCRFRHLQLGSTAMSALAQVHHYVGHFFITAFVLFWPVLFVTSIARPATASRKVFLGGAAIVSLLLFLFVSFTGYALPPQMPRELTRAEAAHALRFVVLHVVVGPLLTVTGFALILWRHTRSASATAKRTLDAAVIT
jgi:apolipoprotein N-acyltransferase